MSTAVLQEKLKQGLVALGENPNEHPTQLYMAYLDELLHWNKAYNLTGIREVEKMITYHLLDSLSVLPYLKGPRCLDVGTGAGLPGMILALARPELQWVLLDSKSKKVRFLQHIVDTLKPANVEIVQSRVEDFHPRDTFSTIITRALTNLTDFYQMTEHLRNSESQLLAMKGKYPEKELSQLGVVDSTIHELTVPGLGPERFLIVIN